MGLDVTGKNAGGGEIFSNRPENFLDPPYILNNGYRVLLLLLPGVKW
jgi:hypothetical protein